MLHCKYYNSKFKKKKKEKFVSFCERFKTDLKNEGKSQYIESN